MSINDSLPYNRDKPALTIQRVHSGGVETILSNLFTLIKQDVLKQFSTWNILMIAYLLDPKNGIPRNSREQSSAKGNLDKEFAKPNMTWKVFCKAIRFLNIMKFDIIIKAHHANGSTREYIYPVNLGESHVPKELINGNVDPTIYVQSKNK
jgi:hypothetical protein